MQQDLANRLAFGDRALHMIVEAMPLIRFDQSKRPHLYAAMLHASIVQLCGGCLAMARTEHTAGIPVLLRSMFEAIVDLDNLVRDPSYHERMEAADRNQFRKVAMDSPQNPLLAGLDQKYDIGAFTANIKTELDQLRQRGRGSQDLRIRCKDVGREHEYTSLYRIFCFDAHNNVTALFDRHLSGGEQSLQVDVFGDGDPMPTAMRIHWAIGWMLQSAEYVHGAFGTEYSVAELLRHHEALKLMLGP